MATMLLSQAGRTVCSRACKAGFGASVAKQHLALSSGHPATGRPPPTSSSLEQSRLRGLRSLRLIVPSVGYNPAQSRFNLGLSPPRYGPVQSRPSNPSPSLPNDTFSRSNLFLPFAPDVSPAGPSSSLRRLSTSSAGLQKQEAPYGESDFQNIIKENLFYADKTKYVDVLETHKRVVFLRPARFGKTLFLDTMRYYYDKSFANTNLFRGLDIEKVNKAKDPAKCLQHKLRVLALTLPTGTDPVGCMDEVLEIAIDDFLALHADVRDEWQLRTLPSTAVGRLALLSSAVKRVDGDNTLAIFVDEYDRALAEMIADDPNHPDIKPTSRWISGLLSQIKASNARFFITGQQPFAMAQDSIFNFATHLSHRKRKYANMLGLEQADVKAELTAVCGLQEGTDEFDQALEYVTRFYNGYRFFSSPEPLYNPQLVHLFCQAYGSDELPHDGVVAALNGDTAPVEDGDNQSISAHETKQILQSPDTTFALVGPNRTFSDQVFTSYLPSQLAERTTSYLFHKGIITLASVTGPKHDADVLKHCNDPAVVSEAAPAYKHGNRYALKVPNQIVEMNFFDQFCTINHLTATTQARTAEFLADPTVATLTALVYTLQLDPTARKHTEADLQLQLTHALAATKQAGTRQEFPLQGNERADVVAKTSDAHIIIELKYVGEAKEGASSYIKDSTQLEALATEESRRHEQLLNVRLNDSADIRRFRRRTESPNKGQAHTVSELLDYAKLQGKDHAEQYMKQGHNKGKDVLVFAVVRVAGYYVVESVDLSSLSI